MRRGGSHRYPRSARVNQVLHEVLAEELERLADRDERLGLLTITDVLCEPDLRHATVLLASMDDEEAGALGEVRVRLQAAVSRQVRLKRTPQLRFAADPAVAAGERVEAVLRDLAARETRKDPPPGEERETGARAAPPPGGEERETGARAAPPPGGEERGTGDGL